MNKPWRVPRQGLGAAARGKQRWLSLVGDFMGSVSAVSNAPGEAVAVRLTAGGKCLGVTRITNGCCRLHPVEWNIGEAAGALAACALRHHVPPRAIRARHQLLAGCQELLVKLGIQLSWPDDISGKPR